MIKFLDLKSQYLGIKLEIDSAISSTIESSAFIGGEKVKSFELDFAQFQQANYCIGVGNGTDALEIAIEALSLPVGSEIIVPANSFFASSEAVTRSGHRVVFCDCTEGNYTLDLVSAREKITAKTAAIIAVHLYGHPCDMDGVLALAAEFDLKIIEDCAQAHAAEYKGKRVGAIGHIGTFSFYPGKNLGAYGDGGAILTNDKSLAETCRMIANHGRVSKFDHEFEGRNSRLDTIQAAILSEKLKCLELWTDQRILLADQYLRGLASLPDVILPRRESWARQVYHLFVIRTKKRDALRDYLKENNIETGVHYPKSLPKLKAYQYLGPKDENLSANIYDHELLSLPIGEHMSVSDSELVITAVRAFFEN